MIFSWIANVETIPYTVAEVREPMQIEGWWNCTNIYYTPKYLLNIAGHELRSLALSLSSDVIHYLST
jgi:hypothetical protein